MLRFKLWHYSEPTYFKHVGVDINKLHFLFEYYLRINKKHITNILRYYILHIIYYMLCVTYFKTTENPTNSIHEMA